MSIDYTVKQIIDMWEVRNCVPKHMKSKLRLLYAPYVKKIVEEDTPVKYKPELLGLAEKMYLCSYLWHKTKEELMLTFSNNDTKN